MKILIVTLFLSIPVVAKDYYKLKKELKSAKTNVEMKMISKKITKSYEIELKIIASKIKKGLKGEQLKSFINSQKNWTSYLHSEDTFLMHEFGQRNKHGTSAALTSRTRKNELLESRLNYLKALSKSI